MPILLDNRNYFQWPVPNINFHLNSIVEGSNELHFTEEEQVETLYILNRIDSCLLFHFSDHGESSL